MPDTKMTAGEKDEKVKFQVLKKKKSLVSDIKELK